MQENKETLHIYTIGSDKSKLENLEYTSRIAGLNIHVTQVDNWTGYINKITKMIEILENEPPDNIVGFVDAYDVLSFAKEEEILKKFKEYNCEILLSSELNCYPPKFQNEYDEISTQMQSIELQYKYTNNNVNCETHPPFIISTNFKYVNSGGYIGYAKSILQMLKWKSIEKITEICLDGGDQSYFNYYYLKNAIPSMISFLNGDKLHIQIDYKQTIFQSMYRINFTDFYFINGRLYNSILHSKPCFAHFNGYKIYDDKIMSLDTETAENVYEVFIKNIISSFIQWDTKHPLNYRVLYYLFYNGKYQFNLPQIK